MNDSVNNHVTPAEPSQSVPVTPEVPAAAPAAPATSQQPVAAQTVPVPPVAPVTPAQPATPLQGAPAGYYYPAAATATATAPNKNKKLLPILIAGAAVLFVLIVVGVILLVSTLGKTTVDMSKYYQIKITGFNGYAEADIEEILDPYDDLIKSGDIDSTSRLMDSWALYSFFENMDYTLSKEENISNGDTIEVTFSYNEELAQQYKFRMKNTTLKLKVEGLSEATSVDPFADLEVEFSGVSPKGNVTVNNNNGDDFIRRLYYSVDKSSGLKNGDTIEVTVSYDKDYALKNGYVLTAESKSYTVSGLAYYLDDKSELSDADRATLESEFRDQVESCLASRYDDIYDDFGKYVYGGKKVSVSEPQYVKGYLLSRKNTDSYYGNTNRVVIIYQVSINMEATSSYNADEFGERTGYVAVEFCDVGVGKDGAFCEQDSSSYRGYQASASLETLESDLVTSHKADYIVSNW